MEKLDDRAMLRVADYFKALAEPLRLKLLNALRDGEKNVGELTGILGCSQANVSKHLALLSAHGLVKRTARGTSVYYDIADRRTYDLCDLVCGHIASRLQDEAQAHAAFLGAVTGTPRRRRRTTR